jgi:hypothetical protein
MKAGKRYVGLDLTTRTMEVCMVKDGQSAIEQASGMKTDGKSRERLARLLTKTDVVGDGSRGIYACGYASSCWRGIYRKRSAERSMCSTPASYG